LRDKARRASKIQGPWKFYLLLRPGRPGPAGPDPVVRRIPCHAGETGGGDGEEYLRGITRIIQD